MTVHCEVEVLYKTTIGPACGHDARGPLTTDHAKVTCRECRHLCGLDVAPYTRVRFDTDPKTGRARFAA